jgi:hypothetical protein
MGDNSSMIYVFDFKAKKRPKIKSTLSQILLNNMNCCLHILLNLKTKNISNIIITYFLKLASCSKHFISIKHRILASFNINKTNQL